MSYKRISLLLSAILLSTAAIAQAQVSPSVITLGPSQTQQFSVAAAAQTTWAVEPVGLGGSITPTGLYTAPASYITSIAYVYALSGGSSSRAQVNLSPTAVVMTGSSSLPSTPSVSISVSPSSVFLLGGQSVQFTASVTGATNQQVAWSVVQGVGSISNGLYTAPSSVSADALITISATSIGFPSQSASATIMLAPAVTPTTTPATTAVSISLRPRSHSLTAGQSKQFTATVSGSSNTAVTWSLSPSVGAVLNGLYTAPATISSAQSVTLTATSVADPTQCATSTISLAASSTPAAPSTPPVVVSIGLAPTTATLTAGQSQQFNPSVSGTTNTAVTWSLVPNVGTILNGLYTPPATIGTQQAVTVVATSVADSTKVASASVTLQGPNTSSFTPIRVRSGGGQYVDPQGLVWAADYGYSGNTAIYSTSAAISGTTSPLLYQDQRYGKTFQYSFPAPSGTYTVTLKFAEIHFNAAGARVFNVVINGQPALTNFDIFAQAGGRYRALDESFTVVSSGQMNIQFSASVNNAEIDAIQILQGSQTSSSPAPTTVSPALAAVAPSGTQPFSVQNLPTGTTVAWGISPTTGSISQSGSYTAPASVATQQTITVTATNASTSAVLGTATLTLQASTLQASPAPTSVSPATASVAPSGTQPFSVQNLPAGTTVAWAISPTTGGITQGGSYTAPASVATQTTITVTATNASTSAVLGTATLTLQATPATPSVSPATATVAPGGTQQFSVQNLPTGTTVAWAISHKKGSITNGLYSAPASMATQQTITVTATNASTSAVLGTATLTLLASPSVSPATATVAALGTQQFSVQNLPAGTVVMWQISPSTGTVTQGGNYTAPASVATQQSITVTATNASTAAVLGTASLTLQASPAAPPASTNITLPIEVVGPTGTTASASFSTAQGANLSGQLQLWMQIHNLKYDSEASVKVNNSAWLPLSTGNVTLLGNAAAFGGIGGGFHTLQMTVNLPAGVVTTGTNTITFRFNGTNGVTSGFRVLAFNIQSDGSNLLLSSLFVNDDPNNWQPPSTAASDIAAGLALYQGASLTTVNGAIQAHCSDCHTQDGRDLKYFNYSNNSIQARAVFHGLSAQQGNQIASYIRSLNLPNPGRPWNPPYQPGPGLDSQPVANWSAGAGIDAVLDSDADMLPYMAPGGSTAGWSPTSYLNAREIPTALQLLDWNSWLPVVHPMDAFGAAFTSSPLNLAFSTIRSGLQPNSPTTYQAALYPLDDWFDDRNTFLAQYSPSDLPVQVYSVAQWQMVKMWELNQDFGLEGMPQVPYGAKADVQGWFGGRAFATAPNILHIPAAPGIGNGTGIAGAYLSMAWYHLQLVQNDGQGSQSGHDPIDYGYMLGFVRAVYSYGQLPGIMEQLEVQVKDLQEVTLTGTGPQAGALGWHPMNTSPANFIMEPMMSLWSGTSPAEQTTLMQAYTQAWFEQASQYTPQQYYQGGWATATENPATDGFDTTFGGLLWYMLPRLRYFGVSNTLTDQISAWAATIFPQGNWTLNNTASCNSISGFCLTGM